MKEMINAVIQKYCLENGVWGVNKGELAAEIATAVKAYELERIDKILLGEKDSDDDPYSPQNYFA